mgnify:CR=1 FL=1
MKGVKFRILSQLVVSLIAGNLAAIDRGTGDPVIPASAKTHSDFVPEGWEPKTVIEGDLNRDQRDDVALVISSAPNPPSNFDSNRKIHVLVLALRQDDGTLKRSAVSDGAILDDFDGGLLGYPFQELRIERGAVVIEHYGGSRNRWEVTTRYRYESGHWVLIGRTDVDTDVHYPNFIARVDHNISTGLVIRNFKAGGLRDEDLTWAQTALTKQSEVRYWRLPAPALEKAPEFDGPLPSIDWGPHSLDLNRKEQIIENPEVWKGPADLSGTLRAVVPPEGLFLGAEVTDDQVTEEDKVRLTNQNGDEIQPDATTRTATTTGYVIRVSWSKAQLRAALGENRPYWLDPEITESDEPTEMEELPVVIEIHDADAGQPEVVLTTRPIGIPHAAAILISSPTDLVLEDQ